MPKFGFADMGYLMLVFERTFQKDLKTEKKFEIYLSNQIFLVTKWWKIKISKLGIF